MIESTKQSGKSSVLILGGEPLLLMDKVLTYIKGIKGSVKEIYLTTSLPQTIETEWNTFCEICQNLTGLNVSLQHYESEINNNILQSKNPYDRIELLKKILSSEFGKKVRVSINLVKGSIDNREDIIKTVTLLRDWGCKWLKINELQGSADLYVSFRKLFKELKHKSPYAHGCQYDIDIFDAGDMRVTLKESCFLTEQLNKASFADLIKAIIKKFKKKKSIKNNVLYEDGTLVDGWMKEKLN